MKLPSLNGLRAFEATVRFGSIAAAAQALHVTPSAISHQLKRLEEQLDVRLLDRESKRLALTHAGESYYREIAMAFERLEVATMQLRKRRERKTVAVTTGPVFAIKWLVPRLASFHQAHPDIEVRVSTTYRMIDFQQSDDDLGIRWGSGDWPGVRAEKLLPDTVQPVCSPSLLGKRKLRRFSDLRDYRLIYMSFQRDDWKAWARQHGIDVPEISKGLRFNEPLGAIQAALDGLGIALGPTTLVHDDLKSGRLIAPFDEPLLMDEAYYVVYPEGLEEDASSVRFKEWLFRTAADYMRDLPEPKGSLPPGTGVGRRHLRAQGRE